MHYEHLALLKVHPIKSVIKVLLQKRQLNPALSLENTLPQIAMRELEKRHWLQNTCSILIILSGGVSRQQLTSMLAAAKDIGISIYLLNLSSEDGTLHICGVATASLVYETFPFNNHSIRYN